VCERPAGRGALRGLPASALRGAQEFGELPLAHADGPVPRPDAVTIQEALRDKVIHVRAGAVEALGNFGHTQEATHRHVPCPFIQGRGLPDRGHRRRLRPAAQRGSPAGPPTRTPDVPASLAARPRSGLYAGRRGTQARRSRPSREGGRINCGPNHQAAAVSTDRLWAQTPGYCLPDRATRQVSLSPSSFCRDRRGRGRWEALVAQRMRVSCPLSIAARKSPSFPRAPLPAG
jgi:hypothetical protein